MRSSLEEALEHHASRTCEKTPQHWPAKLPRDRTPPYRRRRRPLSTPAVAVSLDGSKAHSEQIFWVPKAEH
jgi:hypothetical protein